MQLIIKTEHYFCLQLEGMLILGTDNSGSSQVIALKTSVCHSGYYFP